MSSPRFPFEQTLPSGRPERTYHSYVFDDGETMEGFRPIASLREEADLIFRHDIAGKSVLDIGAWDGYFSFEAEKRGASRVLATDNFCWTGPGWGTRQGFEYAHNKLGSKVEALDIDVPDLTPAAIGTFDVVLFLGVLYHVKDPLRCVEAVSAVCTDMVICDTVTALDGLDEPVMRYFIGDEMSNDPTNFWSQNKKCLQAMFTEYGFKRFEFVDHPAVVSDANRGRTIMHAWR